MADERARYFRRLRRLRSSARRWSVLGGGLTAAAAVLTPYAGIGVADAAWAASAGASAALAWWRWSDHRALAAEPLNGSDGYKVLVMQNDTGMTPQVVALAWTQEMTCDRFTEGFIDAGRAFRAAYTDKGPEFVPPN